MRRVAIGAVVAVVLCVVAIAVVLVVNRHNQSPAAGNISASSTVPSPAVDPDNTEAHEVATALKRLSADPDSLVASTGRELVADHARQAVPPGSTVEIDEHSWAPDRTGGGVIMVAITSPGRETTNYAVIMQSEDSEWKVAATLPITMPPASTTPSPTR